jgi:hypothetical protein
VIDTCTDVYLPRYVSRESILRPVVALRYVGGPTIPQAANTLDRQCADWHAGLSQFCSRCHFFHAWTTHVVPEDMAVVMPRPIENSFCLAAASEQKGKSEERTYTVNSGRKRERGSNGREKEAR